MSHRAISRQLHMNRESVIRYARAERFPERTERPTSPGILAPHETYLRTRFLEGERNAVGFFREVVARGYAGSRMSVERFLLGLRRMEREGIEVSKAATSVELTPRRAVGLMLRRAIDLTEEESRARAFALPAPSTHQSSQYAGPAICPDAARSTRRGVRPVVTGRFSRWHS